MKLEELFIIIMLGGGFIFGVFVGDAISDRDTFRNCLEVKGDLTYKNAVKDCENILGR